jgi:Zn-dependent protease with chaperone function
MDHVDLVLWAGRLVGLVMVYLIARWVTWLGMSVALRRWRRAREQPWAERARLAWPGRRVGALSFLVVVPALLISAAVDGNPVALLTILIRTFLIVLAGYVGIMQTRIGWERHLNPAMELTPRAGRGMWYLRTSVIGDLALAGFALVGLVSRTAGLTAWAIVACGTLAIAAYLSWGWTRLMRWMGILRPASPRLQVIVEQVAGRMRVRPVPALEAALPVANAFAFIADKTIGVTDATMAILSDDELTAVCAHELAHLSEPSWVRAVRLSTVLVISSWTASPAALVIMFRTSDTQDNLGGKAGPLWTIYAYVLLLLCFIIFYRRLYRRMEIRADAMSKAVEPAPASYARALEKIYATNLVPVVISSRRHRYPELYDRLAQAGAPPEYPRPSAPPRGPLYLGLAVVVLGTIAGYVGLRALALFVVST